DYRLGNGDGDERGTASVDSPGEALEGVPEMLKRFGVNAFDAVGHRIVHGGAKFSSPTLVNDETVEAIEALTSLAPLRIPANLKAVELCRSLWPDIPQVAVFDTAFHLSNPAFVTTYPTQTTTERRVTSQWKTRVTSRRKSTLDKSFIARIDARDPKATAV